METLKKANLLFQKIAGSQKPFEGNGRMMKYVIEQETDDGTLLFNTLTCEFILIDKNSQDLDYLKAHWFIVPENFDEKRFVQQLRPIFRSLHRNEGVTSYTILTTTDCNARCFYCYEKGRSRIPMSLETAGKISDHIIKSSVKKVRIGWFGGEPLYNLKVIDKISTDLKNAGIEYTSTMISNSYLFNPEVVKRAKSLWNLKNVQVTLDGTEDVYNRCKAYYRITDNAYKRVLENIQLLLDAEIRVVIRMNIDLHNADDLMFLADELKERFGGNKHFFCYSHMLFDNCTHVSTVEEHPLVEEKQNALQRKLKEYGMMSTRFLPRSMRLNCCMSDSEHSVLIAPTGDFGKCEHYTDSEFFSHIDYPDMKDENILKEFADPFGDTEICNDCAYYPQCMRLKKCPDEKACSESLKANYIKSLQKLMVSEYTYLKDKQKNS